MNPIVMSAVTQTAQNLTSNLSKFYSYRKQASTEKTNASSFYRQSMLYERQGNNLMQSARSTASIAPKFIEMGKANARNSRIRAGQVQYFIDANQSEVVKEAQQKVGEGLASFAANGVMIESRDGAAVAMWEQDEAADASYQQLIIAQKGQDTIWEYLMEAQQKEAEGYAQAAQAYSRASEIAGGAYTGYLQSYEANRAGDAAAKAARKAKHAGVGVIFDSVLSPAGGNFGEMSTYW